MRLRSFASRLLALAIALGAFDAPAMMDQADPWQRLRSEMTKEDVLALLGAPPWTDRTMLFEFWMYEVQSALASGVIVFERERVFSWRPPAGLP